jgi:hypothetical protein
VDDGQFFSSSHLTPVEGTHADHVFDGEYPPLTTDLANAFEIGGHAHAFPGVDLTPRQRWSLPGATWRRKIMARRSKKLTPAQKQRRTAQQHERDRLEC